MSAVKFCQTCQNYRPLHDFTSAGYKCIGCKTAAIRKRNERYKASGIFKRNKLNYKNRHKNEPRYWISERLSQYQVKDVSIPKSDLTVDYLVSLYEKQGGKCHYTGQQIFFGLGRGHAEPNSASLDRLVPALGYTVGNVAWCSYRINTMKGNLSEADFYDEIERILQLANNRGVR